MHAQCRVDAFANAATHLCLRIEQDLAVDLHPCGFGLRLEDSSYAWYKVVINPC